MVVFASLGDYLYIIIGILWLVFSVYNSQKKKSRRVDDTQKSKGKSFLDTLIDEFNVEPTIEPVPYTPYATSNKVSDVEPESEKPVIFSYDDEVEESNETATSVVYRKREFGARGSLTAVEDKIIDIQPHRNKPGFDLRKAVIYSEILNRRYF
ncbi:MAG: hypothetical protein WC341_01015 [Bacteroidales bacterium]|jgi:hypothetical protein